MGPFDEWERRQADLFYADLVGRPRPIRRRRFARAGAYPDTPEDAVVAEAVPQGGRGRFRHAPLGGDPGDNVEVRWNIDSSIAAGSVVDIVVHLHGYGDPRPGFLERKAALAGIEMVDPTGQVRIRRGRPTLALVPRGRDAAGGRWFFDNLPDRAAFDALVDAALSWFCTTVLTLPSGSSLARRRLTLMAHSGGGAGVSALLANGLNPDEVVCFDSMYGGEESVRRWAEARMASPEAPRSGLRIFYLPCSGPSPSYPGGRWIQTRSGSRYESPGSWSYRGDKKWHLLSTEVYARRVHRAIQRALARTSSAAALAERFRVERTSVAHNDIPGWYSPLLLDDIAATAPNASPPPEQRPACVENDDWLTRPPGKPGGDDPPPPKP